MEDNRYKVKGINILDIIETEMVSLWLSAEIPEVLKEDEEFVEIITSAIMLERVYWSKYMVVGEA